MTKDDKVTVECDADDEFMQFAAFQSELTLEKPPMVYLSTFLSSWYVKQSGWWEGWWRRLRMLFAVATGNGYRFEELTFSGSAKFEELADFFGRRATEAKEWERQWAKSKE